MNSFLPPLEDISQKQCNACEGFFPATLQYFHASTKWKDGLRNPCKVCRTAKDRKHRTDNLQTHLDYEKEYRESHREQISVYSKRYATSDRGKRFSRDRQRKYRAKNPHRREYEIIMRKRHYWQHHEYYLEYMKQYRETHHDEMRQLSRNYYYAHQEKYKAHRREYKKVHHTENRLYENRRRARKKAIPGTCTGAQIVDLLKRQRYCCYYARCGYAKFKKANGKYIYHIDHTFPITREGARNDISYLVLACPSCNISKGNKYPWEFYEGGRLL